MHRLAVDEKRCCSFWGFEVRTAPGLALRWDAPPSAGELLDRIEAVLTGDEPVTALSGLL